MKLVAGQKMPLEDAVQGDRITVDVDYGDTSVDVVLFGLSAARRIENENYTVLHSHRASPTREIAMTVGDRTTAFEIDLDALPPSIARLLIVASHERMAMSQAVPLVATVGTASFDAGAACGEERALSLLEIYRHAGRWKVAAVGQGFAGGLPKLVEHLGAEVAGARPAQPAPAPPTPVPQAAPSADRPPPAAVGTVSLDKITLERSQAVSLDKLPGTTGHGPIILNLTWSPRAGHDVDLDLGCLYELSDGTQGIVQALGKAFGSLTRPPYIALDQDDRSGRSSGETIRINGDKLGHIKRLAVFALIYEGAVRWSQTDARASILVPGRPEIEVLIRQGNDRQRVFGLVVIDSAGGSLRVTNHMTNYPNQKEYADATGIYLNWKEGRKD